jgi:hypothetical protein
MSFGGLFEVGMLKQFHAGGNPQLATEERGF